MLNQNPMSVMAQASKLSITQLQQAIKNGTVPPYIGVPLLQQKIKESQQAKQAMAAQQPQQPPIAQQVMQQAEAQGVDALPSNLPVQGMAGGGIIAFAEGGKTFIGPISPEQFDNLIPSLKQDYVNQFGAPPAKSQAANPIGVTPRSATVQAALQGTPMRPQVQPAAAPTMAPANPMIANQTAPAQAAPAQAISEAEIRAQYRDSIAPRGAGADKGSQGIDAFRIKPAVFDDKYLQNILDSENNPATGKPYTPEEIKARRRDEEEKAGIDRTIYKSQRSELDDLKAKYKKGSKLDEAMPFFAAAEALTRPVKSGEAAPSFIGSLASGLGAYGKTSAELTDKQEAKLEKIRAESNALALAQNAFTQAEINGDRTEIKSAKDALNSHYKALSDFGIKKAEADALADAETKKIQAQIQMNKNSVGATYYAADKASREIDQMAMQIQIDAAKAGMPISKSEATRKAYEDKAAGAIYGANLRDVASQRTSLTKAIGDIQKQYPMGIAMPPEVKSRYTALTNQLNALGTGGGAESAGAAAVSNNPYGLTVSKG
jgi:hypothetical protein